MTSLRLQKGTYIYADEDGDDDAATTSRETQRQRQATVYDAVAGMSYSSSSFSASIL